MFLLNIMYFDTLSHYTTADSKKQLAYGWKIMNISGDTYKIFITFLILPEAAFTFEKRDDKMYSVLYTKIHAIQKTEK